MRALTRKNLIAIAAGMLLAGLSLVAFDFWLSGLINRQGQQEVDTSALRAIALAESRVVPVLAVLDDLAAHAVDSCGSDQIEAMRRAAFSTLPIKEIAVLAPDGKMLCSDLGLRLGPHKIVSSEPLAGAPQYFLEVMEFASGRRMVRLRRSVGEKGENIAALVPSAMFLPHVSSSGHSFGAYARIVTPRGALIGQIGKPPPKTAEPTFTASAKSKKFGFGVKIALPRAAVIDNHASIARLGPVAIVAILFGLLIFAVIIRRRTPNSPVAELERALSGGEFVPYYQPIVDIRSGQLRGAEVLVRWKKCDGTLVLPNVFIPLAESSGLIRDLTRSVMRRVCAEMGSVIGARPALKISFNFAGQLFGDQTIVRDLRNIFAGTPIRFSQVVLEVTEREPIENFTETRQIIAALQGLGMRVAIDDVGTGHSGLSYILKLGVDMIKIDKMFVDAIGSDRNSTTIVETLIDLAHNMRMDVVAEGVESFEQVMYLRDLGVRSAQGNVFAPPLPGSAFVQLVEAIDPVSATAGRSGKDVSPRLVAANARATAV